MELPGPNGTKSSTSSPSRRSQSSGQSVSPSLSLRGISTPPTSRSNEPLGGSSGFGGRGSNAFSKFISHLKNLIVEAANIEPTSDVSAGVDHCCKTSRCHYGLPIHHLDADSLAALSQNACSATLSSLASPHVTSRLIVYRDCDRRGRKILFDSEHVSSDYVYLKPSDPKLLKQLGDYVFGCVPIASASNPTLDFPGAACGHKRFCKWKLEGGPQHEHKTNKTLYIWSKIFELGSYNANRSTKKDAATSDYSSSSSENSSSGYESGGGGSTSSSSVGSGKTFSLPLFPPRPSSSWSGSQSSFPQTRSLPGRIDNYKTNLALVWVLVQEDSCPSKIPLPYLSPLVESLMLNPLSHITHNYYHNSNHFVTSLKNVSSSLNRDLSEFVGNAHVVNLSLVKPPLADMVNAKLVQRILEMLLTNLDGRVVLNLKKWTEVKAILYFLKVVLKTCVCKCNLLDSRRDSLVETGTDVISAASVNELDCVDSGIELEGNGSSSSSKLLSSSSVFQAGRKWSIVSEEESDLGGEESGHDDEDSDCHGVRFHLGDADVDQSEAHLALGEVDLSKLKGGKRRASIESSISGSGTDDMTLEASPKRPPLEVKLSLSDGKLKDACSSKYTPCYYCNGTYITEHSYFNPFYFCQVMTKPNQQVVYDLEYVTFMKIIECSGTGSIRSFNLSEERSSSSTSSSSSTISASTDEGTQELNELSQKIKEFVEGYVQLAKVTNDSGKLDGFATFQMEVIRDNIL